MGTDLQSAVDYDQAISLLLNERHIELECTEQVIMSNPYQPPAFSEESKRKRRRYSIVGAMCLAMGLLLFGIAAMGFVEYFERRQLQTLVVCGFLGFMGMGFSITGVGMIFKNKVAQAVGMLFVSAAAAIVFFGL